MIKPYLVKTRRCIFETVGNDRYSKPALYGLDDILAKHLDFQGGTFVEAGANDGFTQSNTYFLERFRGWSGILVEGIPELYRKANRLRTNSTVVNAALVPFEREGEEIEMIYGDLMSVVKGARGGASLDAEHIAHARKIGLEKAGSYEVRVKGRALSSILDENRVRHVDFMSLDVEGFEAQVLAGLDLSRHCPTWICIETQTPDLITEMLAPFYDSLGPISPMDLLFRKKNVISDPIPATEMESQSP